MGAGHRSEEANLQALIEKSDKGGWSLDKSDEAGGRNSLEPFWNAPELLFLVDTEDTLSRWLAPRALP